MKVVLDISPLQTGHKTRGIGTYTRYLSQALRQVDRANSYILTTRPQELKPVDLIHYPYFDLFAHTLPLRKLTKTIVTIHDVIPLVFPQWFKPGWRGRFRFLFQKLALKKIDAIITDSHHSKADIIKYFKFSPSQVHVIPLASAPIFSTSLSSRQLQKIKSKYHLPQDYLLYVGDINPHKNLDRLVQAFKIIFVKFPQLKLVLVSRALSQPIPETTHIKQLISDFDLTKQVKILTTVPMDPLKDLVGIYTAASIYVHPSLYEGFGLPVLEAMATGTLVVCSAVASLPEVYDQAAITFNPYQLDSIVASINQALQLTKVDKEALVKKGKVQAAQFSWQITARETIKVYHQVIHGKT